MFQLLFVFFSTRITHIELRGCPGMGTTWATNVIPCMFEEPVYVNYRNKHEQCFHENWKTFDDRKLLVSNCTEERNCIHAVIARHPLSLKYGKAQREWETYYNGWIEHSHKNVKFLRFETLLQHGCTKEYAKDEVRQRVIKLENRRDFSPFNKTVWDFWNYSYDPVQLIKTKDEI